MDQRNQFRRELHITKDTAERMRITAEATFAELCAQQQRLVAANAQLSGEVNMLRENLDAQVKNQVDQALRGAQDEFETVLQVSSPRIKLRTNYADLHIQAKLTTQAMEFDEFQKQVEVQTTERSQLVTGMLNQMTALTVSGLLIMRRWSEQQNRMSGVVLLQYNHILLRKPQEPLMVPPVTFRRRQMTGTSLRITLGTALPLRKQDTYARRIKRVRPLAQRCM